MQDAEDEDADPTAGMYAKYDRCLHGPRAELSHPPLCVAFLKKFLTIVKRRARCALMWTPEQPWWPGCMDLSFRI